MLDRQREACVSARLLSNSVNRIQPWLALGTAWNVIPPKVAVTRPHPYRTTMGMQDYIFLADAHTWHSVAQKLLKINVAP